MEKELKIGTNLRRPNTVTDKLTGGGTQIPPIGSAPRVANENDVSNLVSYELEEFIGDRRPIESRFTRKGFMVFTGKLRYIGHDQPVVVFSNPTTLEYRILYT